VRAGDTLEMLANIEPRLLPYTQICDSTSATAGDPYCMPGDGIVPLENILNVLPAGLPLSLEYHQRDDRFSELAWATHVLDGTRRFLRRYQRS
jgi:sugar phosphate isomerase/epimerase